MIRFHDWTIEVADSPIARQFDHLSRRIEVRGDLPEGWDWALLVQVKGAMDIISLLPEEGGAGTDLTADQLSVGDAYYHLQLRGTQGDAVRHTNVVSVYVPGSLSGAGQWPQVPSEFTQVEQRILAANSHPPVPGERGCWMLWNADAGQYEDSEFPLPEGVGGGADGGYYVPAVDDSGSLTWTASKEGMPAVASVNIKGPAGSDGLTPHVGANGNWWLGDEDTGVSAGSGSSGSAGGDGGSNFKCITIESPSTTEEVDMIEVSLGTTVDELLDVLNADGYQFVAYLVSPAEGSTDATKRGTVSFGAYTPSGGFGCPVLTNAAEVTPIPSISYANITEVNGYVFPAGEKVQAEQIKLGAGWVGRSGYLNVFTSVKNANVTHEIKNSSVKLHFNWAADTLQNAKLRLTSSTPIGVGSYVKMIAWRYGE